MNKIFCIGMNKTGTSSLHQAFLNLGYKSIHQIPDNISVKDRPIISKKINNNIRYLLKNNKPPLSNIDNYTVYMDILPIVQNFKIFNQWYPGSKFIYTDRNTDEWIQSRIKHIERNIKKKEKNVYDGPFLTIDEEEWRKEKEEHYNDVMSYFKDNLSNLLIMDICSGDGYEKLCPFLNIPILKETFPKENVSKYS
jgi:hypothetical protein